MSFEVEHINREYKQHPLAACSMTLVRPLTDDPDMRDTLDAAVNTFFG
ncbi:CbbQ/NirQ/NorQ C-terminal domain-containing protein [Thiothrix unzii]|nr:CbbQ/NirQ/NorQ C-terminal domain-containing protein [Thiothrix unzii]